MSTFSISFLFSHVWSYVLITFFTRERCMMVCGTMVRVEQQWKTITVKFMLDGDHYIIKEYLPTLRNATSIFRNLQESYPIQKVFQMCSKKHKSYCEVKFYADYVECKKCQRGWDRHDGPDLELQKIEEPTGNETA
jgi:hypothetical protein